MEKQSMYLPREDPKKGKSTHDVRGRTWKVSNGRERAQERTSEQRQLKSKNGVIELASPVFFHFL